MALIDADDPQLRIRTPAPAPTYPRAIVANTSPAAQHPVQPVLAVPGRAPMTTARAPIVPKTVASSVLTHFHAPEPAHPTSALLSLFHARRQIVAAPAHAALAHFAPRINQASLVRQGAGASVPPKVTHEREPHPWSLSHPRGPRYTDAQLKAYGATPDEIWIIRHESSGYAWAWNPSPTATGHAYGLGQITGLFRLQHFGRNWESADPRVQIKMMQLYIRIGSANFHTPAGAKAFWEAHGWY